MLSRMMLAGVVAVGIALAGAACTSSSNEDSGPAPITTSPASRGATTEAQHGELVARGFLGLPEQPMKTYNTEDAAVMAKYEALAGHFFDVLETQTPGALDRFGTELSSKDADRMTAAWADMRTKLEAVAGSDLLRVTVAADPQFSSTVSAKSMLVSLLDTPTVGADGIPNLGMVNGRFGDDNQGKLGALKDLPGLGAIPASLSDVDSGRYTPDPESRLGAYAATAGYPPGTVGNAVHHAIGTIYVVFGTYGEEKIGRVFNDPAAKALYNDPVTSASGQKMAQIELRYWNNVAKEDPYSGGGKLGSSFGANFRNWLQQNIFGSKSAASKLPSSSSSGGASSSSGGASSSSGGTGTSSSSGGASSSGGNADGGTLNPTVCGDKPDGWWCQDTPGFMAYCKDKQITGGCACAGCNGQGQQASCSADPSTGVCPD